MLLSCRVELVFAIAEWGDLRESPKIAVVSLRSKETTAASPACDRVLVHDSGSQVDHLRYALSLYCDRHGSLDYPGASATRPA
jgi:hypothetical protein